MLQNFANLLKLLVSHLQEKISKQKWSVREFVAFRNVFTEKDPEAAKILKGKADFEADADLRDFENVPLKINIEVFFKYEVLPFA
mgnify:CR=1 FL=1